MCIRDRQDQASVAIDRVDANIEAQLEVLRLGAVAGLVFLALSQLAPLYLGWEMLPGRRDPARRVPIVLVALFLTLLGLYRLAMTPRAAEETAHVA